MAALSPQLSSDRIEVIDVLRGFTLFGIILVHIVEQYYAGQPPAQYASATTQTLGDNIVAAFVGIFITGKFYMIFSFLFGLSFFIQSSKSGLQAGFLLRFGWRLLILFIIGFIHHIHYRGDILTIYAMLGAGLLLCYRLPDKVILTLSVMLILNIPSLAMRTIELFNPSGKNPFFNADPDQLLKYYTTIKSGAYGDILNANYHEFNSKMQFQIGSGRLYITLGLFLLGLYAGRINFFKVYSSRLSGLKKAIRYSFFTLGGCIALSGIIFGGAMILHLNLSNEFQILIGGFVFDVFNTCLAIVYTAGILILFTKEQWKKRLMILYPVGRMGLTVYLMQTFFGTLLFFGYGAGLLFDIGASLSFLIAVLLFIAQIYFSRAWFKTCNYGPVEWLWRSLTYFKIQPILKQPLISTAS